MPENDSAWEVGTFEGLRDRQRREMAAMTPQRRLECLEEMLRFAERVGILATARRRRQEDCDAAWRDATRS